MIAPPCKTCGATDRELDDGLCGACWAERADAAGAPDPTLTAEIQRFMPGLAPAPADDGESTLISFADIEARPVRWAWQNRIALAKLTALSGRPKIGKGLFYSHLIAAVTRGTLDGDLAGPRNAILVTTEDEPGDTLKPRLMAAGADLSRVSMFQMGSRDEPVPFRVPQDADALACRVAEVDAALVVIDPLMEFIDGKTDSHKSQPVRQALASLNQVARDHGCAVVVIYHLNKGASTDPLLRQEGAAAFTQIVRGGLILGFDPDDPDGEEGSQRVLAAAYSNLARPTPSLVYRIEGSEVSERGGEPITTARMVHIGESSAASHDLLKGREDDEARADRDEATEFLSAELADGPRSAKEVKAAARDAGISERTLNRAKAELGVKSGRVGGAASAGHWEWSLTPPRLTVPGTSPRGGNLSEPRINKPDAGFQSPKDATGKRVASIGAEASTPSLQNEPKDSFHTERTLGVERKNGAPEGDGPKGTPLLPEKPSPSSPSAFQAVYEPPEGDGIPEGDGSTQATPSASSSQTSLSELQVPDDPEPTEEAPEPPAERPLPTPLPTPDKMQAMGLDPWPGDDGGWT